MADGDLRASGGAASYAAGRWRPRKLKKDGTPRKSRRGWGPYRSVPNERSVDFNLTLDVQNLQQTVRNLSALRDILHTKALVQRHSPEGSQCKLVHEYLHVFRKGVLPLEMADDRDQRALMHRVMAEEVDMGYGLCGPDAIMAQMANYSTFLRFICLRGIVDTVVVAEDSVMISDKAWFQFQVTRRTIEMVFPHILGNEWLVAQLVDQEVEAEGRSTFYFNTEGKCYRYDVEMNFVGAFTKVVKNPHIVNILLGRALITHNAMLGVIDDPDELEGGRRKHLLQVRSMAEARTRKTVDDKMYARDCPARTSSVKGSWSSISPPLPPATTRTRRQKLCSGTSCSTGSPPRSRLTQ